MFDLKEQIESWKHGLLVDKLMSVEDVEELASHIECTIDELQEAGLSAEEAFYVAFHRMGDRRSINAEYIKVNPVHVWRKRFIWLTSGYLLFSLVPIIVKFFIGTIYLFDIEALLFQGNFLFGEEFQTPYPVYVVALLILTGILVYFTSEKSVINKKPLQPYLNYRVAAFVLLGYGVIGLLNVGYMTILPRITSVSTIGNVSASSSFFVLVWHLFLALSLFVMLLISRRRHNRTQFG